MEGLFPPDERGFYHNVISLIISQRIRFRQGQQIRKKIYELQKRGDLTKITELTEEQRNEVGLDDQKWAIIQRFDEESQKERALIEIKGIGPWTIKCAQIMAGDYSCGFIPEDLAVRKELSRRLKKDKTMTIKETREFTAGLDMSTEEKGKLFSCLWNDTRK